MTSLPPVRLTESERRALANIAILPALPHPSPLWDGLLERDLIELVSPHGLRTSEAGREALNHEQ